ncbi:hexosaminidase [Flavobacteriaceae bacterium MAR_2010_188]|nr:hexosaminidase [Flavobacteriaceae bacterium MAR_2010_188]
MIYPTQYLIKSFSLVSIFLISLMGCEEPPTFEKLNIPRTNLTQNNIIPRPLSVTADSSGFALDTRTVFVNNTGNEEYDEVLNYLKQSVVSVSNFEKLSKEENKRFIGRAIVFDKLSTEEQKSEAYQLIIKEDTIFVSSNSAEGAFRAVQTLRQLIPEQPTDTLTDHSVYLIPTGEINDSPLYSHRGTMLDVSRHFFEVDEVKKYIDILAYYKINVLHLHLSDDQGWRIEIKSWPLLTEIGGKTEVGGGTGGFYTQEDYKEIVDYAAKHFITIIPEIDMPGHTNAASLSYPILNGNGKKLEAYTGMKVGFSTFDTRKDSVYVFIDDVIREISAITPGPYFHIGGDESHSTDKDDYIYFVNKVEKIVQKYGKKMIGWDEIATADVDSSTISQFWQNDKNALLAKNKNLKIIYSPAKKAYLDMKYSDSTKLGLRWAGFVPVDSSYNWAPSNYVKDISNKNILGVEAPLWSESITNLKELQYLAFPRIIGIAEIGWSSEENRNWDEYRKRLGAQFGFLKSNNVNFFEAPQVDWERGETVKMID